MNDQSQNEFINVTNPDLHNTQELFQHMDRCVKTLKAIDIKISKNIDQIKETITETIDNFPQKCIRMKFTNKILYIIYKYFNLLMKYQGICFSLLCKSQKKINEFEQTISEYLVQKIPVEINFQDFLSSIFEKVDESKQKVEFKLKSLFYFVKSHKNVTNEYCLITNKDLSFELKKIMTDADINNCYIHQNSFDLLFESYIESNDELLNDFLKVIHMDDISTTINEYDNKYNNTYRCINRNQTEKLILKDFYFFMNILISKRKEILSTTTTNKLKCNDDKEESKEFDFDYFENLVVQLCKQITSSNKINDQVFVAIRCASLRFLCNKYYIMHHQEWLENISDDYIQNCLEIINQTPHDLKVSKEIVPDNLYDIKFESLLLNDDFKKSIEKMSSIQFLNCPIDIWHEVELSINLAMNGANRFTNNEIFRPNIAFDDFFSIVLPVFASAQIMCPKTLHFYLSIFKKMKKTISNDIIAVSSIALTGYIGNCIV